MENNINDVNKFWIKFHELDIKNSISEKYEVWDGICWRER